jgi:CPA1 family monovalent cation:H+ antiporter
VHSFEYILVLLGGVLVSSIISQRVSRVSTPLIQIGIGIALSVLPIHFELSLEPELFFILFIAPLLFADARHSDKSALWRLKRPILLLALGLVFLTALGVGYFVHWFEPSIPLAAAFALAAALAPTDAVAVASLKRTAAISRNQDHLLQGEALLNDASGIVSFQFAIAAVLTGTFSLLNASIVFAAMFFGGLLLGVALMLLRFLLVRYLRNLGIESITFHVLFELLTPFLVFLVAEVIGVSGIIAVVAAGITHSFAPRRLAPHNARQDIVSTSVWSVISFTLNGLVFLILGTQLPNVARKVWETSGSNQDSLVLFMLLILIALLALRFIWVLVMHWNLDMGHKGIGDYWKRHLHDALVLSLTGAKGAMTLAVVLAIPQVLSDGAPFPERDLLIFLASGVILLSLLAANFLVPLIAPKKNAPLRFENEFGTILKIYRSVVKSLNENALPEQKTANNIVIRHYVTRLNQAKRTHRITDPEEEKLRAIMIGWEREHTLELIDEGRLGPLVATYYLFTLSQILARVEHHNEMRWTLSGILQQLAHYVRRRKASGKMREGSEAAERESRRLNLRDVQRENYHFALEKLESVIDELDTPAEAVRYIISDVQNRLSWLESPRPATNGDRSVFAEQVLEIEARALEFERAAIEDAVSQGLVSRKTAKYLRDNVAIMSLDIEEQIGGE